MMKVALMRTATGKEDPGLPLLQRISSLELTAPQIAAQNKCFTEFKKETHLNIKCPEEIALIRPSWSKCCTTKGQQLQK